MLENKTKILRKSYLAVYTGDVRQNDHYSLHFCVLWKMVSRTGLVQQCWVRDDRVFNQWSLVLCVQDVPVALVLHRSAPRCRRNTPTVCVFSAEQTHTWWAALELQRLRRRTEVLLYLVLSRRSGRVSPGLRLIRGRTARSLSQTQVKYMIRAADTQVNALRLVKYTIWNITKNCGIYALYLSGEQITLKANSHQEQ